MAKIIGLAETVTDPAAICPGAGAGRRAAPGGLPGALSRKPTPGRVWARWPTSPLQVPEPGTRPSARIGDDWRRGHRGSAWPPRGRKEHFGLKIPKIRDADWSGGTLEPEYAGPHEPSSACAPWPKQAPGRTGRTGGGGPWLCGGRREYGTGRSRESMRAPRRDPRREPMNPGP